MGFGRRRMKARGRYIYLVVPATVVALSLQTAWATQTTVGLSNPVAAFNDPITNAAQLPAGWIVDAASKLIYTSGSGTLTGWDFTNGGAGWEFVARGVSDVQVFNNCKFNHAVGHNRIWNYGQNTGSSWSVTYNNCDFNLLGASSTVNGAFTDGNNPGTVNFNSVRFYNATTAYFLNGYSNFNFESCYFGPMGIGSDATAHMEFLHVDGGQTRVNNCMMDQRTTQGASIAGGWTAYVNAEGFNSGTNADFAMTNSICCGANTAGPSGIPWSFQGASDPAASPPRPGNSLTVLSNCAISRGVFGYYGGSVANGGSLTHTATGCVDFDTGSAITTF